MRKVPGNSGRLRGFTLVEAIVVIVVVGIIAAVVAIFVRQPVLAYLATAARAELTDTADTALRRMVRDLREALPNSVRTLSPCGAATACIEFIPVVAGGRYRAELTSGGAGNPLDFSAADTSFDVIGPGITVPAGTLSVVVYNLGIAGADAYSGTTGANDVRRVYSGGSGSISTVNITSAQRLPFDSPARRFHIVRQPVTYRCDAASRQLSRVWDYGYNVAQADPGGGATSLLSDKVTACTFEYSGQTVAQRAGAVLVSLQLTNSNETVSMAMQTHVSNVP
jgi:MSHA biogenesis protein MshO